MAANQAMMGEKWYVLRDLLRSNSTHPAYKVLPQKGVTVYTPMKTTVIKNPSGVTKKVTVPYIHGLLFAYGRKDELDAVISKIEKLQYQYVKGGYQEPMVVPTVEMERFIRSAQSTDSPKFLMPREIPPSMCGSKVMVKGGALDGVECRLIKAQGSKTKKVLVEIPGVIAVKIEIKDFEYLIPIETK